MSVTSLPFYVVEMSQPKKHTNLIYVQKVILKNNSSSPSPPPSKKKQLSNNERGISDTILQTRNSGTAYTSILRRFYEELKHQ